MFLPVFVCRSVCQQDYSKTRAWIQMKCCVSTDVGTWTNWLTFYPDPDYSPDAPTYTYWWTAAAAKRGFKMVLFTEPSEHLCRRYMRSTECPSSYQCSRQT